MNFELTEKILGFNVVSCISAQSYWDHKLIQDICVDLREVILSRQRQSRLTRDLDMLPSIVRYPEKYIQSSLHEKYI